MKMKILTLILVILSNLNYAIAEEKTENKESCLDIIHEKPLLSLGCFEKSENKYSKIFQSYIYFFDLVEISNKNQKIKKLIDDFIAENQNNLPKNWVLAQYSSEKMLKNEKNFLTAMNLLAINLPISFITYHKEILLNSYQSYFNNKNDKFLGNIIYGDIKLRQFTKLSNLLKNINNSNDISTLRNQKMAKIKLLYLPHQKPHIAKIQIENYLKFWSYFGLWNMKKYHQIQKQKKLAIKEIAQYYQRQFDLNHKKSTKIAEISIDYYLAKYLPIKKNIWSKYYNDPLFTAILEKKKDLSLLIEKYKENNTKRDDKVALITFLNAAIIQNYDLKEISNIIENIRIDNLNNKGNFGYISAPLFIAINNLKILEFLLKDWFFNPNQRNSFGKTPIFRAVQENNLKAAEILLKYGAHIDLNTYIFASKKASYIALSTYQRTALIYAAWQGDLKMIEFLIKNGANIKQKDSKGKYAIDYLEKNRKMPLSDKIKARELLKIDAIRESAKNHQSISDILLYQKQQQ